MPDVSFGGLVVVAAIAVAAPLLVGLVPALRLPAVVLEIVAGITLGPSGLGWVEIDLPLQILSLLGLAFLLFLAGLEIDVAHLRGRLLRRAGVGYLVTIGLGVAVGLAFRGAGWVHSPLLLAIALSATSLGLIVPVLKDARRAEGELGQLTIAGASVARFDLDALLDSPSALVRVPPFLLALLVVRAVPAALYAPVVGRQPALAAGLLQATSLPFLVTASQIGLLLGEITPVTAAALVSAGLLSVVVFPPIALSLLRERGASAGAALAAGSSG